MDIISKFVDDRKIYEREFSAGEFRIETDSNFPR